MESAPDEDFARSLGRRGEFGLFEVAIDEFVEGPGGGDGHLKGPMLSGLGDFFRAR